jgi:hypothetical protein
MKTLLKATIIVLLMSAATATFGHAYDAEQAKRDFLMSRVTLTSGQKWESYFTSDNEQQRIQAKEYLRGALDAYTALFVANIDETSQYSNDEFADLFHTFGKRNNLFDKQVTSDILLAFLKHTRMLGELKDVDFTVRYFYNK